MVFYWIVSFVFSFIPEFNFKGLVDTSVSNQFIRHVVYYVPVDVFITYLGIFIGILLIAIVVRVVIDLL